MSESDKDPNSIPTPRTDDLRRELDALPKFGQYGYNAEARAGIVFKRFAQLERELAEANTALVVEKSRATDLALELEKARPSQVAPIPSHDEIIEAARCYRTEINKRMNTKHPSSSPSIESMDITLKDLFYKMEKRGVFAPSPRVASKSWTWEQAAHHIGEQLAKTVPAGWHKLPPQQWVHWCNAALSDLKNVVFEKGAASVSHTAAPVTEKDMALVMQLLGWLKDQEKGLPEGAQASARAKVSESVERLLAARSTPAPSKEPK